MTSTRRPDGAKSVPVARPSGGPVEIDPASIDSLDSRHQRGDGQGDSTPAPEATPTLDQREIDA